MATTVTKTIGTGGDYTTLQSWEDACPANLVSSDQIWQGKVKNQEFSSASSLLVISGTTTDETRYVELTTDTGASFVDNANIQTNALRYNASNGAAVNLTGQYAQAILNNTAYFRMSKLQVTGTGANNSRALSNNGAGATNIDVNQCILESKTTGTGTGAGVYLYSSGGKIRNSVVIARRASTGDIIGLYNGMSAYNCTFVSVASTATTGIRGQYSTSTLQNVYLGNATTVTTGSTTFNKTTCYTSVSGPPSGWSAAAFSTSSGAYFQSVTDGTHDFRITTSSTLKDAGTTDSTNAANDIAGTARPSGSAYDVGCWEFVQAAGGITGPLIGGHLYGQGPLVGGRLAI
jgi:hypothetical protein